MAEVSERSVIGNRVLLETDEQISADKIGRGYKSIKIYSGSGTVQTCLLHNVVKICFYHVFPSKVFFASLPGFDESLGPNYEKYWLLQSYANLRPFPNLSLASLQRRQLDNSRVSEFDERTSTGFEGTWPLRRCRLFLVGSKSPTRQSNTYILI
ncbi:hypothetical protein GX50_01176 [[Emmonsia] crescens]|uniref:Uncharacterized protein n=1 Tax=[Emmonsia] crescens TaxID=73230 RepID=A0A2B7ZPS6_9EURO|nr:hypothetical protein GX50_01176 [Emmonsia crescens]